MARRVQSEIVLSTARLTLDGWWHDGMAVA